MHKFISIGNTDKWGSSCYIIQTVLIYLFYYFYFLFPFWNLIKKKEKKQKKKIKQNILAYTFRQREGRVIRKIYFWKSLLTFQLWCNYCRTLSLPSIYYCSLTSLTQYILQRKKKKKLQVEWYYLMQLITHPYKFLHLSNFRGKGNKLLICFLLPLVSVYSISQNEIVSRN